MEKGEGQLEKPAFPPQVSFQCIQKLPSVSCAQRQPLRLCRVQRFPQLAQRTPWHGVRGSPEDFDLKAQACKPRG